MKKILIMISMSLLLVSLVYAQDNPVKIFKIDLTYTNGTVILSNYGTAYGYPDDNIIQPEDGYSVRVESFSNKTLYSSNFSFSMDFFYDTFDNQSLGGSYKLEESSKTLMTPYFRNAKDLIIYSQNGTMLFSTDISQSSNVCNNDGVCEVEYDESYTNCPQDCQEAAPIGFDFTVPAIIALAAVVMIALLIYRRKRNKVVVFEKPY